MTKGELAALGAATGIVAFADECSLATISRLRDRRPEHAPDGETADR
jgi:hypothetical protein